MKIIGITGGVGAGKSTVLNTLKQLANCDIVMADDVAKELMKKGNILTDKAIELFGEKAYDDKGNLNRNHIANIIFYEPEIMKMWEAAVHPATNHRIFELINNAKKNDKDFIFIEAALLIENGYDKICDEIWYVYADETTRRERLKRERLYSNDKIDKIIKGQMSDVEFRQRCKFIIDTSGSISETKKQLENKLEEY